MISKQVFAPVAMKITPDHVNMVGFILGVIKFNEKSWPLYSIIMPDARLQTALPGEENAYGTMNILSVQGSFALLPGG
jgi:hypothetical protein